MKIASLTDFELMKQTKDAARFILEKHPHLFPLSTMQRQIEAHKITNN